MSADLQSAGVWPLVDDLDDLDLAELATQLPATMLKSRADSSVKKYLGAYRRWRIWASSHKLPAFPANARHIALYLQRLGNQLHSKSPVEEAVHALAWVHNMAGLQSPTTNPLVQTTLQGLKRIHAKPVKKKKPVDVLILSDMVEDAKSSPTLANLRITTISLMAFAGFLRSDEALHIRACDLEISQQMAKLSLPHSKTDQFRKGNEVLIARTGASTCPVAMLEQYLAATGIRLGSDVFLFRGIVKTKNGEKLRESGPLSYTTVREQFRSKLIQLGYSPEGFGLHSLRSGGASAAAKAGIPDRLF